MGTDGVELGWSWGGGGAAMRVVEIQLGAWLQVIHRYHRNMQLLRLLASKGEISPSFRNQKIRDSQTGPGKT